ncbi:hypothetical protein ACTXT7_010645 [Hymenolepis weldensis]
MASENPEPPSPPNNKEASNQPAKKRSQTQKRLTAAQKERDRRRAMIEQCHVQSLFGLDIILQDGVTKTTFTNYIGEHQSQIFYGGFDIQRPSKPNIHISLGQPTPIDLGNSDSGPAVCLAVPTYIFRRFPSSEKPVSSASSSDSKNPPSPLSSIFPNCTPKNGLCLVTFKIYFPIHFMASANKISSRVRCGKEANLRYTPEKERKKQLQPSSIPSFSPSLARSTEEYPLANAFKQFVSPTPSAAFNEEEETYSCSGEKGK